MLSEIVCEDLQKTVDKKNILHSVSIRAKQGEIVALLGPNGAGKTTIFSILCGTVKPTHGVVKFNSKDITDLPMYKRARLGIGYLPQEASIFRGLSVEENVMAALEISHKNKKERELALEKLLDDLSLAHIRQSLASSVSGGERRKLEIARALALKPKFILLDEPLAGIDPIAIQDMRNMIESLKKRGIGVIVTDHNVRDTIPIADRAYIVFDGKIIAEGTAQEIVRNAIAKKMYFGEGLFAKE